MIILGQQLCLLHIEEIKGKLVELERRGNWVFRGNSRDWVTLKPTIDCKWDETIPRTKKLEIERQSIEQMRKWDCNPEIIESFALHKGIMPDYYSFATCDLETLMLLRHYNVPTRLLDWSKNPYIAAYFSVAHISDFDGLEKKKFDGEIWAFDEKKFEDKCSEHWRDFPIIQLWEGNLKDQFGDLLNNGKRQFESILRTAFAEPDPGEWIMPVGNRLRFPRYEAQKGVFTITGRFGIDHAAMISKRLEDSALYVRFIIHRKFKKELREFFKKKNFSRSEL